MLDGAVAILPARHRPEKLMHRRDRSDRHPTGTQKSTALGAATQGELMAR